MRNKKRTIGILIVVIIVLSCLSCSLLLYRCNTTKNYPNNIKVGELYQPNLENVKYDESSGISYMDNIVIVTFNKDVDDGRKNEIVNQINGKLVGKIDDNIWEIEITSRSLNELKKLIKELQDMEDVFYAFYDSVNSLSSKTNGYVTPNDPWKKGEDWLKQGSSGSNWGLEAIQVPYAWNYKDKYNKIKIGIVDNGFDTKHEDLTIQFANHENEKLNNRADHGTQVAGIIGATENNEKGITGIVWNKELICYDAIPEWYQDKNFKSSELKNLSSVEMAGIIECVKSGAKVINFSIGLKDVPDCSNGKINLDESQINDSAELASFTIAYLRTYYPDNDFIIVQASGNGDKKGFGVDTKNNGYFCSITSKNYFNKSKISLNEILDRIIVVGAVEKDGDKYKITKFSNCGSPVDIVAPGKNIYSTCSSSLISAQGLIPYKYDEGTSFSAPMVTSVASLVWSINESFSPSEVKEIVCNNYADWVRINPESVYTTSPFADKNGYLGYPMVNAKLAVEEAIRRTDTLVVSIEDETQSTEPVEIEELNYDWHISPTIEAEDIIVSDEYNKDNSYSMIAPYDECAIIQQNEKYGIIKYDGSYIAESKYEDWFYDGVLEMYVGNHAQYNEKGQIIDESLENTYVFPNDSQLNIEYNSIYGRGNVEDKYIYDLQSKQIYNLNILSSGATKYTENSCVIVECYDFDIIGEYDKENNQYKIKGRYEKIDSAKPKYGIAKNGKLLVQCEYEDGCMNFSDGIVALKKDGKWGYFDDNGNQIIDFICETFTSKILYGGWWKNASNTTEYPFLSSCGYIPVKINGQCGYYDTQGNEVIPCGTFEDARPVHSGLAWVKKDGKWGVIKLSNVEQETTDDLIVQTEIFTNSAFNGIDSWTNEQIINSINTYLKEKWCGKNQYYCFEEDFTDNNDYLWVCIRWDGSNSANSITGNDCKIYKETGEVEISFNGVINERFNIQEYQ